MSVISNEKISKASNVRKPDAIYNRLAEGLSKVDIFNYVKIYNGRILASNVLSTNGKKEPITTIGKEKIVGVELLIDVPYKTIQFFSITSSVKGSGEQIVNSVIDATPDDWNIVVVMDWSHGFWPVMVERYPRLMLM